MRFVGEACEMNSGTVTGLNKQSEKKQTNKTSESNFLWPLPLARPVYLCPYLASRRNEGILEDLCFFGVKINPRVTRKVPDLRDDVEISKGDGRAHSTFKSCIMK